MKIAIAGKGGAGKTTIAGTLARLLAREGAQNLVAVDADSNPNLALTLGISRERAAEIRPLDRGLVERVTGEDGKAKMVLKKRPEAIFDEYAVLAPDGVRLLLMGRVEHAGVG